MEAGVNRETPARFVCKYTTEVVENADVLTVSEGVAEFFYKSERSCPPVFLKFSPKTYVRGGGLRRFSKVHLGPVRGTLILYRRVSGISCRVMQLEERLCARISKIIISRIRHISLEDVSLESGKSGEKPWY